MLIEYFYKSSKYYNHKLIHYLTLFANVIVNNLKGGGEFTPLAKKLCFHSCDFDSDFASLSFVLVILNVEYFKILFYYIFRTYMEPPYLVSDLWSLKRLEIITVYYNFVFFAVFPRTWQHLLNHSLIAHLECMWNLCAKFQIPRLYHNNLFGH